MYTLKYYYVVSYTYTVIFFLVSPIMQYWTVLIVVVCWQASLLFHIFSYQLYAIYLYLLSTHLPSRYHIHNYNYYVVYWWITTFIHTHLSTNMLVCVQCLQFVFKYILLYGYSLLIAYCSSTYRSGIYTEDVFHSIFV